MKKISREKIETLQAVISSRRTRVAFIAGKQGMRDPVPAVCPVCGSEGVDILRVQSVDGDTWRLVHCDACGPGQGGLSPADAEPDLAPGETWRTAMLDQGDDDGRWEATERILADVDDGAAEDTVRAAIEKADDGTMPFDGEVAWEEWIGGGLGPRADEFYESEIFSDWPDRESWRVLCVLNASRLGTDVGDDLCIAVVNRGARRGVWAIL